jgi:outer membrane protein assembly factor BamB
MISMHVGRALLVAGALGLGGTLAAAENPNWPHWRGPGDDGIAPPGSYPVKWDANHLRWKAPLPGKGRSTPVVWNDRIFVTSATNGMDVLMAFDTSGRLVWQKPFGQEEPGKHPNGSGSNASPVTDGQGVFVYFNSGTLAALEPDGRTRWQTNLVAAFGPESRYWDQGTSPVLTEKSVLFARMHHGESWLAAFDKQSGRLLWKVPRNFTTPEENDTAYTTPLVVREGGKETVLVWGAEHVTAHSASDGQVLWTCGDFNPKGMKNWPAVASPVVADGLVIVPAARSDKGYPRIDAIRLGGSGDVSATHRSWVRQDTGTYVPTPAAAGGRLFLLRDHGQVDCLEVATGKTVWQGVIPKVAGVNFYGSPLIAGGRLYAVREDGVVFVARIDDKFELLAENPMGEKVIASPVPLGNRLLIRGEQHLFCVE